jgi:FKBP-type peptidyl-prolyl cis-trans isomerase (trigger factor)
MMTVGSSPLLGFDNNMLGMTVGETREFDFVAPDGGLPSISGKTVHFKLTLSTGAKNLPCPLDDELAKRMDKKTYSELCEMVSQAAFARVSSIEKMHLHDAIARKLITETKVAVPNWMTLSEAQFLATQSQLDWNTMIDPDREKFMQMAEPNVKLSLILDKIRETEPESQLTDQEVFEIIKQNLMQSKMTDKPDEAIQAMAKNGQLQALVGKLRDEQAMSYVAKNIKVVE